MNGRNAGAGARVSYEEFTMNEYASKPFEVTIRDLMVVNMHRLGIAIAAGFIAGWLAPRRGILAGFLAGLIGYFIYSAIFFTYWSAVLEGGPSGVIEVLLQTVVSALSWGLSAAAAGGTAQLLRSKTSAG
jgi:uncharacterized membrane protein YeaQ/YmgE (transglycosylase-associated protein family)